MNPNKVTPEKIYLTAKNWLGLDASPKDSAPDELGCAETVSDLLFDAGCIIPIMLSTTELVHFLNTAKAWKRVYEPQPGDVIISPTGEGGENGITHGHTGIVMDLPNVASNDSRTGNFMKNYTLKSWSDRWEKKGGYPIYFFRIQADSPPKPELPPEVAKTVSDALGVAKEASTHPELKASVLGLLSALGAYLKRFI